MRTASGDRKQHGASGVRSGSSKSSEVKSLPTRLAASPIPSIAPPSKCVLPIRQFEHYIRHHQEQKAMVAARDLITALEVPASLPAALDHKLFYTVKLLFTVVEDIDADSVAERILTRWLHRIKDDKARVTVLIQEVGALAVMQDSRRWLTSDATQSIINLVLEQGKTLVGKSIALSQLFYALSTFRITPEECEKFNLLAASASDDALFLSDRYSHLATYYLNTKQYVKAIAIVDKWLLLQEVGLEDDEIPTKLYQDAKSLGHAISLTTKFLERKLDLNETLVAIHYLRLATYHLLKDDKREAQRFIPIAMRYLNEALAKDVPIEHVFLVKIRVELRATAKLWFEKTNDPVTANELTEQLLSVANRDDSKEVIKILCDKLFYLSQPHKDYKEGASDRKEVSTRLLFEVLERRRPDEKLHEEVRKKLADCIDEKSVPEATLVKFIVTLSDPGNFTPERFLAIALDLLVFLTEQEDVGSVNRVVGYLKYRAILDIDSFSQPTDKSRELIAKVVDAKKWEDIPAMNLVGVTLQQILLQLELNVPRETRKPLLAIVSLKIDIATKLAKANKIAEAKDCVATFVQELAGVPSPNAQCAKTLEALAIEFNARGEDEACEAVLKQTVRLQDTKQTKSSLSTYVFLARTYLNQDKFAEIKEVIGTIVKLIQESGVKDIAFSELNDFAMDLQARNHAAAQDAVTLLQAIAPIAQEQVASQLHYSLCVSFLAQKKPKEAREAIALVLPRLRDLPIQVDLFKTAVDLLQAGFVSEAKQLFVFNYAKSDQNSKKKQIEQTVLFQHWDLFFALIDSSDPLVDKSIALLSARTHKNERVCMDLMLAGAANYSEEGRVYLGACEMKMQVALDKVMALIHPGHLYASSFAQPFREMGVGKASVKSGILVDTKRDLIDSKAHLKLGDVKAEVVASKQEEVKTSSASSQTKLQYGILFDVFKRDLGLKFLTYPIFQKVLERRLAEMKRQASPQVVDVSLLAIRAYRMNNPARASITKDLTLDLRKQLQTILARQLFVKKVVHFNAIGRIYLCQAFSDLGKTNQSTDDAMKAAVDLALDKTLLLQRMLERVMVRVCEQFTLLNEERNRLPTVLGAVIAEHYPKANWTAEMEDKLSKSLISLVRYLGVVGSADFAVDPRANRTASLNLFRFDKAVRLEISTADMLAMLAPIFLQPVIECSLRTT